MEKYLPFYELIRGNKRFLWDKKCEEAFTHLKQYLTTPPVLSKPDEGDILYLYIAVSSTAVSSVLIEHDMGEQKPIFYMSKRMTDPETRCLPHAKMALAIITSARKLQPYFQSHSIEVLSNQPLRTVMQNCNQSGRLAKWAFELSEHDITYKNRTDAKSQVLADFLIELSPELEPDLIPPDQKWILHVDGSSTNKGSGQASSSNHQQANSSDSLSGSDSKIRTTRLNTNLSSQGSDLRKPSKLNGLAPIVIPNSSPANLAVTATLATSKWTHT